MQLRTSLVYNHIIMNNELVSGKPIKMDLKHQKTHEKVAVHGSRQVYWWWWSGGGRSWMLFMSLLPFRRLSLSGPTFCYALTATDPESECTTELGPEEQNRRTEALS